jgi:hypothetical protein
MRTRSVGAATLVAALVAAVAMGGSAAHALPDPQAVPADQTGTSGAKDPGMALAGDIDFSVPSGTFQTAVTVALRTAVTGTQIRYTTNGKLPDSNSTLYSGTPLLLATTTQLRAQPFRGEQPAGNPGTAIYVASAVTTDHDLPILVMDVYGAGKPKTDYVDAAVLAIDPTNGVTSLSAAPSIASRAGVHVRGQSSAEYEKTAYRLELRGNDDQDADYPLFGLPADSDWALRAPYFDKSLIHDAFAYSMGNEMGLSVPRFRFCEVYLNLDGGALSAADYMGVYLLTETVKVSKDRLDLAKLKKTDLTPPAIEGGYIFKFDYFVAEEPLLTCTGPRSTCWRYLEVVEPDPLQPQQKAWLNQYVQSFHDALHSPDFADPVKGYRAWIDIPSFIDYTIVSEFSRNTDAYMRSAYFHKDRAGKLTAGPLWDYDLTWGTGGLRSNLEVAGWQYQEQYRNQRAHDWFVRLFQDPAFVEQVAARWRELRAGPLSDAALDARVGWLTAPVGAGAERNFQRWPILTFNHLANWVTTPTAPTWEGQVDVTLTWMRQRAAWLDAQWR